MNKTDSESVCTDSETAIQKLFALIQKLPFRNFLHRFRDRVSGIICTDSKTIPPDSETAVHKLLSPIQKLFPTNSETTIQNLLPTASETTVQKIFASHHTVS